jgi:hypothetical protein
VPPQSPHEVLERVVVGAMLGGIERTGVEITMGEDQSIVLVFQGTVLLRAAIDNTHHLRSLWRVELPFRTRRRVGLSG